MYRVLATAASLVVVVAILLVASTAADAHTTRTVGPYEVKVGWLSEPAYAGILNSLELGVTDTRTKLPVSGLEKTLTVELAAGGLAPVALAIEPAEDAEGAYRAWVIPTVTGSYTFHLTGKIDAQSVDEKFQSGPGTFADVTSAEAAQYPVKVPQANDLATQLADLRASADQARLIAVAAAVIAIAALAAAFVTRRRA